MSHYLMANALSLSSEEDIIFEHLLKMICKTNNRYKPPDQKKMVDVLLNATKKSYYDAEMKKLQIESETYGIAIYGDGATIQTVPLINV